MNDKTLILSETSIKCKVGESYILTYTTDADDIELSIPEPDKVSAKLERRDSSIIIYPLNSGKTHVIIKTVSNDDNVNENTQNIEIEIEKSENEEVEDIKTTIFKLSKEIELLSVGIPLEIGIESEDDNWTCTSDNLALCEVKRINNKTLKLIPKAPGNVTISFNAEVKGKNPINSAYSITIIEKKITTTDIDLSKNHVEIRVGETELIEINNNINTFDLISNNKDIVTVKKLPDNKIQIMGVKEGETEILVSAKGEDSLTTTKVIKVVILDEENVIPTETEKQKMKSSDNKEKSSIFLRQFESYKNEINLNLTKMVKITAWDALNSGKIIKNYSLKQLITDMIRNRVKNVSFINHIYAKSAISIILTLNIGNFGSSVTDIQKERMIRNICVGHGIPFNE